MEVQKKRGIVRHGQPARPTKAAKPTKPGARVLTDEQRRRRRELNKMWRRAHRIVDKMWARIDEENQP
jgi:hypothetical protein